MDSPGKLSMIAARIFRIVSLSLPSWTAWYVAFSADHQGTLTRTVRYGFAPVWGIVTLAFLLRAGLVLARRNDPRGPSRLAQLDVLTGQGAVLAWLSAMAILGAVWLGWASLAVVGVLGTGLFHIVVLRTLLVVRSGDPLRALSLQRRFVPMTVTEGDDVNEELTFESPRIPVGFRLFATGAVGPRWATTRHVLEAIESGATVVVESAIGPAVRGDHDAAPIEVWLEDTFGLCRSVSRFVSPARITVLPRVREAERIAPLLERGDGPRAPRQAVRLPTEGSFALREYREGDDVRRIHWMRSVAARELVVRLPDELPPDRPQVRLVLDTFFPEATALASHTPAEVLDALVGVWLAVGRSLAEAGARVTLVTAIPDGPNLVQVRRQVSLRAPEAERKLGAQVAWQNRLMVDDLLTDEATFVVARAVVTRGPADFPENARWIVLQSGAPELSLRIASAGKLQFPMGAPDNRWSLRRRHEKGVVRARRDHGRALLALRGDLRRPPPNSFIARWAQSGPVKLEAVR